MDKPNIESIIECNISKVFKKIIDTCVDGENFYMGYYPCPENYTREQKDRWNFGLDPKDTKSQACLHGKRLSLRIDKDWNYSEIKIFVNSIIGNQEIINAINEGTYLLEINNSNRNVDMIMNKLGIDKSRYVKEI